MKLGFIGNMNNYPFMLADVCKSKGYDVVFVITRKELLHRPENRNPALKGNYPDWIHDFSHLEELDFLKIDKKMYPLLKLLKTCDALLLNDIGPSLWPFLHMPSIVLLTGSDLDHYANYDTVKARLAGWDHNFSSSLLGYRSYLYIFELISRQRAGIKHGLLVNYPDKGLFPVNDKLLANIGVKEAARVNFPMVDIQNIAYTKAPHSSPLKVFSATRISWKRDVVPLGGSALDQKGTDIMIKGLALFYRKYSIPLDIHLVKKGPDIKITQELAENENIAHLLTWHDEMSLCEVWDFFKKSDVIVEQLGNAIPSLVAWDAMAVGRPVIVNTRREVPSIWNSEESPLCHAETPEDVCDHMKHLYDDCVYREMLGRKGRDFIEKYCNPESVLTQIIDVLNVKNMCWMSFVFRKIPLKIFMLWYQIRIQCILLIFAISRVRIK